MYVCMYMLYDLVRDAFDWISMYLDLIFGVQIKYLRGEMCISNRHYQLHAWPTTVLSLSVVFLLSSDAVSGHGTAQLQIRLF